MEKLQDGKVWTVTLLDDAQLPWNRQHFAEEEDARRYATIITQNGYTGQVTSCPWADASAVARCTLIVNACWAWLQQHGFTQTWPRPGDTPHALAYRAAVGAIVAARQAGDEAQVAKACTALITLCRQSQLVNTIEEERA